MTISRATSGDRTRTAAAEAALAIPTDPPRALSRTMDLLQRVFRLPEAIPQDQPLAQSVAEHVAGNDRLSPAEQADIYRRQFFLRHVDALAEDHIGLVHYLGEDGFERLARAYLAAHPPTSFTLRDLGADLATFVAAWDGLADPMRSLCADMARYELCVVEVFDAADVAPPDAARLAAIPEEAWLTRPLVFNPHLHLFAFDHPVPDLRRAIKKAGLEGEPPEPPPKVPPPKEPCFYGIFRRDDMIAYERLTPEAHALLDRLMRGAPLAAACEELSRSLTEETAAAVEAEVGGWFQRWASWGWILDVEAP